MPSRDLVVTARTLERWLGEQLAASTVEVTDLSVPKAGFSNETVLGHARWSSGDGDGQIDFVLRIEPTVHQLFVDPDALRQAQVMSALAGHVPVPRIWLTESDRAAFGAPFFLMERVDGRIPSDVPSWHKRGWATDLEPDQRRRLHDNALAELVRLHSIDTSAERFDFLESARAGTALERYVANIHTFYDWCEPVRRYGSDVIDTALRFVVDEVPADDRRSVVWGDARVGNMVFADDVSVAAMLDWEGAALGPPEIDIAWWVVFDEFLCEGQGLRRLDGVHDRAATLARYEETAGVALRDVGYFEVLAGLQFALINSRLADLLISSGTSAESVASEYVTRATDITKRSLDRLAGR